MSDEVSAIAASFRKMADRIELNAADFGGVILIVPPHDGGEPIETLILTRRGDPIQFWATLRAKCQISEQELANNERGARAFGQR